MGTVASNITQTVSFYNTTGVIEKGHNLYYVPRPAVFGSAYLTNLLTVVHRVTDYEGISISQWSPEDRMLSIKGRIEDFRTSGTYKGLNYAIVTQVITYPNSSTDTFYYAYFVVGARQNGIGAVLVDLEPDHFTNVFFLQKVGTITTTDVFNKYIKNAYVERQHYDRTTTTSGKTNHIYKNFWRQSDELGNIKITFNLYKWELGTGYSSPSVFVKGLSINGVEQTNYGTPTENITDEGLYYKITIEFYSGTLGSLPCEVVLDITTSYTYKRYVNDAIFSNYEESFRFRRQQKDKKTRLLYPLTDTEINTVKNVTAWSSLSDALKEKILKQSIAVEHYVFKDNKLLIPYGTSSSYIYNLNQIKYPNTNVSRQLPDVFALRCVVPEQFKNYEKNIKEVLKNVFFKEINAGTVYYKSNMPIIELMETPKYPEYIASCFITKDDDILNQITFENRTVGVTTKLCTIVNEVRIAMTSDLEGIGLAVLPQGELFDNARNGDYYYNIGLYQSEYHIQIHNKSDGSIVRNTYLYNFFVSSGKSQQVVLNLSDDATVSKTTYFEPILTFSPYSFYSISYLGNIEVPLNKNSYYQEPVINADYIISVTDSMKVTFIPTYKINGNYYKYYTESLSLTLNNEIVFSSEILDQYLIQNKAQMKNQYAINDTNLAKNIGTSALGGLTTGFGVGMMSGNPIAGVVSGLIGAGVGAIGSAITWSVNNKEIEMNQKSKLADVGNMPNTLKQTGTDIATDTAIGEMGLYLNHYTIDSVSYNNIAKYLERYGYLVNIYSTLNCYNRKGWNYIKLVDFEIHKSMSDAQEESIRQIFKNGVTLLHEPTYLHSDTLHNYEVSLDS